MNEVIVGVVLILFGGLLVPVVKSWIDHRRERFESSLELVDTLATCLWTYWKLALRVAYYAKRGDSREYRMALTRWDSDDAWELGNQIQIKVSKSKILLPKTFNELDETQRRVVTDLDMEVEVLRRWGSTDAWELLYEALLRETRPEIDRLLGRVIDELNLGRSRSRRVLGALRCRLRAWFSGRHQRRYGPSQFGGDRDRLDDVQDSYFLAWNEPDPKQRRALLEGVVTPDVELTDPTGRWDGVERLVDRIGVFQQTALPGSKVVPKNRVDSRNEIVRYEWFVDLQDRKVREGHDLVERVSGHRLRRILRFHGPMPRNN